VLHIDSVFAMLVSYASLAHLILKVITSRFAAEQLVINKSRRWTFTSINVDAFAILTVCCDLDI